MTTLIYLILSYLNNNHLQGAIPSEIGNLANLKKLFSTNLIETKVYMIL